MKNRYAGVYNWKGETHTLRTNAGSEKAAHRNFCVQIAKLAGRKIHIISMYFGGRANKYSITQLTPTGRIPTKPEIQNIKPTFFVALELSPKHVQKSIERYIERSKSNEN